MAMHYYTTNYVHRDVHVLSIFENISEYEMSYVLIFNGEITLVLVL